MTQKFARLRQDTTAAPHRCPLKSKEAMDLQVCLCGDNSNTGLLIRCTKKQDIQVDADGFAECPDCRPHINCGPGGISNLTRWHQGTKICKETWIKLDNNKGKKDGSLLSFLRKKPVPIASNSPAPALVHSTALVPSSTTAAVPAPALILVTSHAVSEEKSLPTPVPVIKRIQVAVARLPLSVPEGMIGDALAGLRVDPTTLADPALGPNGLWERFLNGFLKTHLGWGIGAPGSELMRWGSLGMTGLLRFVEYFVAEHGVSPMLFEGKLNHLLEEVDKMWVPYHLYLLKTDRFLKLFPD